MLNNFPTALNGVFSQFPIYPNVPLPPIKALKRAFFAQRLQAAGGQVMSWIPSLFGHFGLILFSGIIFPASIHFSSDSNGSSSAASSAATSSSKRSINHNAESSCQCGNLIFFKIFEPFVNNSIKQNKWLNFFFFKRFDCFNSQIKCSSYRRRQQPPRQHRPLLQLGHKLKLNRQLSSSSRCR